MSESACFMSGGGPRAAADAEHHLGRTRSEARGLRADRWVWPARCARRLERRREGHRLTRRSARSRGRRSRFCRRRGPMSRRRDSSRGDRATHRRRAPRTRAPHGAPSAHRCPPRSKRFDALHVLQASTRRARRRRGSTIGAAPRAHSIAGSLHAPGFCDLQLPRLDRLGGSRETSTRRVTRLGSSRSSLAARRRAALFPPHQR